MSLICLRTTSEFSFMLTFKCRYVPNVGIILPPFSTWQKTGRAISLVLFWTGVFPNGPHPAISLRADSSGA